ncbi:MAG: hypothetical protein U0836_19205 [Pirellulales bacterium]
MSASDPVTLGARIVGGVFGFTFAGIGLAVLGFMWGFLGGDAFGGFGGPPLFFRIFASLIALPFVVVGGAALLAAITGKAMASTPAGIVQGIATRSNATPTAARYECPQCSSPLADRSDVSPHGDAKCGHCGSWFNVHGR